MMENTAENLRLWLRTCPAVSNLDRFGVDFMGQDFTEYAIYSNPSPIKTKTDIMGNVYLEAVQELNYLFVSAFPLSLDTLQNLNNLGFFDQMIAWLLHQNVLKNYPEIAEGRVLSILPTLTPYVMDAGGKTGRYQIQFKIRYRPNPI